MQRLSELHWHPSIISPPLLRQAETWIGTDFASLAPGSSNPIMGSYSSAFPLNPLPEAAEVAASIASHGQNPGAAAAAAAQSSPADFKLAGGQRP